MSAHEATRPPTTVSVEFTTREVDGPAGIVITQLAAPQPFNGWLDLLATLEQILDDSVRDAADQ